jgi:hypothetical protein
MTLKQNVKWAETNTVLDEMRSVVIHRERMPGLRGNALRAREGERRVGTLNTLRELPSILIDSQVTERQRIGNQIDAAFIFARADFNHKRQRGENSAGF